MKLNGGKCTLDFGLVEAMQSNCNIFEAFLANKMENHEPPGKTPSDPLGKSVSRIFLAVLPT